MAGTGRPLKRKHDAITALLNVFSECMTQLNQAMDQFKEQVVSTISHTFLYLIVKCILF